MDKDWITPLTTSWLLNPRYHQAMPAQEISKPDQDALRFELQEAVGSVRHWANTRLSFPAGILNFESSWGCVLLVVLDVDDR
jgi:hypothetical protein